MDRFGEMKRVSSPHSSSISFETQRSTVINRQQNQSRLEPKTHLDLNFSNVHMIQSQFVNNSSNRNPMNQSTINYMKSIYRGLPPLPEDRLQKISSNFIKLFGSQGEITKDGVKNLQKQAYNSGNFQQDNDSVSDLFKVLDYNRDKRITQEDIVTAARRYLNFQKKQIIYTPMVEERLAVARRLFKKFDVERKGYLTQKQVPHLLSETYRCLNKTFEATEQDVKSWMKLTDGNNDGYVTLPQYEQSIIRALKKQGVKIYEE